MRSSTAVALLVVAVAIGACSPAPVGDRTDKAAPASAIEAAETAPPTSGETIAPDAAALDAPKLAVEAEGLRWFLPPNGSARPLAFGAPEADVLASLERVKGPAERGVNQDCGAGPVQYATWSDGLSLVFQNGAFAGWGLNRRATGALSTANGVGSGMTRSALTESFGSVTFQETSLGQEFAAGDMFGVLDGTGPDAKITAMWAGVSCVAR